VHYNRIIQLDRYDVKVMGELKDVMIRLASDPRVHQVIDIVVVDILEAYGLLLSMDWYHNCRVISQLIGLTYGYHTRGGKIK
jgi:hypothetical protein